MLKDLVVKYLFLFVRDLIWVHDTADRVHKRSPMTGSRAGRDNRMNSEGVLLIKKILTRCATYAYDNGIGSEQFSPIHANTVK